jgi:ABC-type transport system involved in multi-copper enzyme maturation permease subunit
MIKTLIIKEIQRGIISLRFLLALILIFAVFIAGAMLFTANHKERMADYNAQKLANENAVREAAQHLNTLGGFGQSLIRQPALAELLCSGQEKHLPDRIRFTAFYYASYDNLDRLNYKLNPTRSMDWTFIIGLVLSFAALVLSFDRISGEKQDGTLRLQCSNPVSRLHIMVSKYLANLFLLAIALTGGMLINLILVSILLKTVAVIHPLLFILSLIFSLIYLSLFLLIGLFISSRVEKSASSLAISLLVWTIIVIFIPGGGSMLGQKMKKIPSSYEHSQKSRDAWNEIWMNVKEPNARGYWNGRDFPYLKERVQLVNDVTESDNKFRDIRVKDLLSQVMLARNLTRISPYSVFRHIMEANTNTGLNAFVRFYEKGKLHRALFRQFIVDKDSGDPDSYHQICAWHAEAYSDKPVDYEEIPQFEPPKQTLGGILSEARIDMLILLAMNLVAGILAFGSFARYDVR